MKLLTFLSGDTELAGVLTKDGRHVLPLKSASLSKPFPTLLSFITEHTKADFERLRELASGQNPGEALPLSDVRVIAPIPRPKNDIYCLGLNYLDHVAEGDKAFGRDIVRPENAVYFGKRNACVIGPDCAIPRHEGLTEKIDYEVEFAVVLGTGGRNIAADDVASHIFGYTIVNDVSARDLQARHFQWFYGKNLDGYCPMGPYIVTADEFSYPPKIGLRSRVNGEIRQESNTELLMFPLDHVIPELSKGITLEAGDIIATGTPAGVGMGFDPPRFLSPGDIVECEIDGIGVLSNPVGK
ncbi:fumarylacetoacetate hydrolase family protein [Oscillospiraceae bacterium OttesenSCG-928-G22]|nr:fumarylacetoacetate hydrolase family protein [Oscillospiraceae bacterium OttesenSCG-928-G22]